MEKIKNIDKVFNKTLVAKTLPMAAALIPLTSLPQTAHAMVPIVVSATIDMNFGDITVDAGLGGTVVVPIVGARTRTGGVNLISGAGLETPASISISGSTGVLLDVTMVGAPFSVDDTAGVGAPMAVNAFDINGGGSTVGTITLAANPSTFPIGATLNVAAGQAGGVYTGTYSVMVNYQ